MTIHWSCVNKPVICCFCLTENVWWIRKQNENWAWYSVSPSLASTMVFHSIQYYHFGLANGSVPRQKSVLAWSNELALAVRFHHRTIRDADILESDLGLALLLTRNDQAREVFAPVKHLKWKFYWMLLSDWMTKMLRDQTVVKKMVNKRYYWVGPRQLIQYTIKPAIGEQSTL